jgi:hypothetical protein
MPRDVATRVWVFDASSLMAITWALPRAHHQRVFDALTAMVHQQQVVFPKETVGELRRERQDRRRPRAIDWALAVEAVACRTAPSWDDTKAVLSTIPEIVDVACDSEIEEADPHVLALARALKAAGHDACVVTEETRDAPWKVALATACGVLRIPTVTLREFLETAGVGDVADVADVFRGPASG